LQKGFPEYSARQAVSQVLQSLTAARQESVGAFAKNTIPAISQARAFGGDSDSFGFLSSLFAGVGQRSGDPEGSSTRTGVLSFLKQIQVAGRGAGLFDESTSVEDKLARMSHNTG
jgi:hypothetical protein